MTISASNSDPVVGDAGDGDGRIADLGRNAGDGGAVFGEGQARREDGAFLECNLFDVNRDRER